MALAATVLTVLVILIHLYIVLLEMVLWRSRGPRVFGISADFARDTKALASNQGLYNGFLVVALVLGLVLREPFATAFVFYGLGCVIVAGLWGALTANRRILYVQALPAALAFVAASGAVLVLDLGIGWLWVAIGVFMSARAIPLLSRWQSGAWAVEGATR